MTTEMMSLTNDSLVSSMPLQYSDDGDTVSDEVYQKVVDIIDCVASPIIIGVGLTGNAVGTATLLRVAGLRCRGIGHLLVAICVSDGIFLVSLLLMWLGRRYGRGYELYHSDGWCQLLTLTTMSSNFLSTWFTVALSVERYVAVRHCRRHAFTVDGQENFKPPTRTSCGRTRTRVAIIALTVLAIVIFVNMAVNVGAVVSDGVTHCKPLQPAVDAMRVLSNIDLVFNVIAPNLIIIGLYIAVGARLAGWHCGRGRAASRPAPLTLTCENDRAVVSTEIRLTKTAVLLSAVVMLLSAPSHVTRTAFVITEMFRVAVSAWIGDSVVQLIIHELFYASFAVSFFVVVASHGRIRRSIVLSMQLALQSTWKRLQVACYSCSWQESPQTTESAELQQDSTVVAPQTNR